MKFTTIASRHPRRVLTVTLVLFVVALVFGAPIVNRLQASLSDFEDSGTQTAKVTG